MARNPDVLIVGAGLSGLAAARALRDHGVSTIVLDKGRGVGGRMATRRLSDGTIADHGAQFFTARDPRFFALVEQWLRAGEASEWSRGFEEPFDGHPRYRGVRSMNALAKQLATGLDVRLQTRVQRVHRRAHGFEVECEGEGGALLRSAQVLLTAPVPQSLELYPEGANDVLRAIDYERCLAVMVRLARPSRLRAPGVKRFSSGPLAWIADNQKKGISAAPCLTIHAGAEFSLRHWDEDRRTVGHELLRLAGEWIDGAVLDFEVHGWRYATPLTVLPERCVTLSREPLALLAGDACGGPRVEGAVLSGWAAAETFLQA